MPPHNPNNSDTVNPVSFTQGGRRHTVGGFTAGPGYDLASGVGAVDARYFVSEVASAVGAERSFCPERALVRALVTA